MCWAWRGWLKTYWLRSLTSWSPTWRAEPLNPTLSHLHLTRPVTNLSPTLSEPPPHTHTVCVGLGPSKDWWEPTSINRPLRVKWKRGSFVNINPAKQKDDETPFWSGTLRLFCPNLLMIRVFSLWLVEDESTERNLVLKGGFNCLLSIPSKWWCNG